MIALGKVPEASDLDLMTSLFLAIFFFSGGGGESLETV